MKLNCTFYVFLFLLQLDVRILYFYIFLLARLLKSLAAFLLFGRHLLQPCARKQKTLDSQQKHNKSQS